MSQEKNEIVLSEEVLNKFKEELVEQNSTRFINFSILVVLSQIIYLVFELLKLVSYDMTIIKFRIALIALCLFFVVVILFFKKSKGIKYRIKALKFVIAFLLFLVCLIGCHFSIYMFRIGIYSFSALYLTALIASFSCVSNPKYSGIALVFIYIFLAFFTSYYVINMSEWIGEFMIGIVFMIVLYSGNSANYYRRLRVFSLDYKVKEQNEKLFDMSQIDELTRIYNRKTIFGFVEEKLALSKRYGTCFCIAILDIDHFKLVNDKYGHNAGDTVLFEFATHIKSLLRETDTFGRWGGEEFILIIPNCDRSSAFSFVERLRVSVSKYNFTFGESLTFSAGISIYVDEKNALEIVEKADSAMYKAKKLGRNQTQIFE